MSGYRAIVLHFQRRLPVFDRNPSTEKIHEIEGIPIYHSEGQDTPYLTKAAEH
ncbi:hypothetical protein [Paenibacillus sp. MMO-177]|uniref:hypothetical protein n=1 Tax=Paenibacillus sp. MMO-177 TaxID=3081289 RepID=UPI0030194F50